MVPKLPPSKFAAVVEVPENLAAVTDPANVAFCDASSVSAVVPAVPVFNSNEPVVSAVCTSADPAVVPAVIELIFFPYKTTQRWPLGTVTVTPESIVIGPTLMPFLPAVSV